MWSPGYKPRISVIHRTIVIPEPVWEKRNWRPEDMVGGFMCVLVARDGSKRADFRVTNGKDMKTFLPVIP